MFGYVKPAYPELLVKEYELYRAVYCGICEATVHPATEIEQIKYIVQKTDANA